MNGIFVPEDRYRATGHFALFSWMCENSKNTTEPEVVKRQANQ
nr:MAG TPA: hypothetical protein [Caudoviricetes sp.]